MATESQDLAADVSLSAGVSLELDSDSLPPLSSEEPSDLPWLPDTDASRCVADLCCDSESIGVAEWQQVDVLDIVCLTI